MDLDHSPDLADFVPDGTRLHDWLNDKLVFENYARGTLREPLLSAFENHFLDCLDCQKDIEACMLLKSALARLCDSQGALRTGK